MSGGAENAAYRGANAELPLRGLVVGDANIRHRGKGKAGAGDVVRTAKLRRGQGGMARKASGLREGLSCDAYGLSGIRMTQFEGQELALACVAAAILAGGLALLDHLRVAAAVNGALAVLFLVLTAPSLIAWALSPDAYVQRYGGAALNEIPFTAGLVAIALIALAGSMLSFAWRPVVFWVSWLANLPTVALFFYLDFWFHVF